MLHKGGAAPIHSSRLVSEDVTSAQIHHGDLKAKHLVAIDRANLLKNRFLLCSQSATP